MSGVVGMKLRNPPRKGPPPRYCSVEGCEGPHTARGLCGMHYERVRKGHPVGGAARYLRAAGQGNITRDGYVAVHLPGHPLVVGKSRPRLLLHQAVLYDAIGPGSHPCHWCSRPVRFKPRPSGSDWLVVDHLDHNRSNNDRANLVPSCTRCNTMRNGRDFR